WRPAADHLPASCQDVDLLNQCREGAGAAGGVRTVLARTTSPCSEHTLKKSLSRMALVASGVGVLMGAALMSPAQAAGDNTQYVHVCGSAAAGHMRCYAVHKVAAHKGDPGAVPVKGTSLAAQGVEVGPSGGYTPNDLASAYNVDPNTPTPGQTVAIVDAHDNP